MLSWQARLAGPFLRFFVKPKLAGAVSVEGARRALMNPWRKMLPTARGARIVTATLGGVPGEWVEPETADGTMLYLHGGGYFACSPMTHRPITSAYARRGLKVFVADYRLAPENAFPAAVDDALSVYRALLSSGVELKRFVIAGDSAGGGLALATLLAAKAEGLPMPACALLFSPWTDLAGTGESLVSNRDRDPMLVSTRLQEGAEVYLQGADARNPLASPLYGSLEGLPPLLLQVGDGEILLDDSIRLAARAREAGVNVDLTVWPGLPHVWQISQGFLPEARAALGQAAAFARACFAA